MVQFLFIFSRNDFKISQFHKQKRIFLAVRTEYKKLKQQTARIKIETK